MSDYLEIQNTDREDNPEFFYGHHVVAFLDLLGQKDRLCEIEGIQKNRQCQGQNQMSIAKPEVVHLSTIARSDRRVMKNIGRNFAPSPGAAKILGADHGDSKQYKFVS